MKDDLTTSAFWDASTHRSMQPNPNNAELQYAVFRGFMITGSSLRYSMNMNTYILRYIAKQGHARMHM